MNTKMGRKGLTALKGTIITVAVIGMVLAAVVYATNLFNDSLNSSAAWDLLEPITDIFADIPPLVGAIVTLSLIGALIAVVVGFGYSKMR
jgi:hypothetical protein